MDDFFKNIKDVPVLGGLAGLFQPKMVSPVPAQQQPSLEQQLIAKGWTKGSDGTFHYDFPSPNQQQGQVQGAQTSNQPIDQQYSKMLNKVPAIARPNASLILKALNDQGVLNPKVAAYALSTAQHETAGSFAPVREGFYNDQKYGYEPGFTGKSTATKLGYSGGPDYYGRGYVQLTHDYNYKKIGNEIGLGDQLVTNPDLALQPAIAAKAMAAYMKDRGTVDAVNRGDFVGARGTINGDQNGPLIAKDAESYLAP